jgi:hypothetical protein
MTNVQTFSPETVQGGSGARLELLLSAETELARGLDEAARQFNAERSWSDKDSLAKRIGVLTLSIARLARVLDPARPKAGVARSEAAQAAASPAAPAAQARARAPAPAGRPEDPPKDPPVAPAARSAAPARPAGERRLKKPADIVFGRSECGRYFTIDEEDLYEDAPQAPPGPATAVGGRPHDFEREDGPGSGGGAAPPAPENAATSSSAQTRMSG